jgi:hypothetical protein
MLARDTLQALFRDLVRDAMSTQQVESSETTEFYLVQLLTTFARPNQSDLLERPLGVDYLEACHLPASQQFERLKRVADTALFVTGVFIDSLERSLVGPEYYAALGRTAYARLSATPPRAILADMFRELAGRFPEFARVLAEISEHEIFRREQDTVRIYKRWLRTGGAHEADMLMRRGLIPFSPPTNQKH